MACIAHFLVVKCVLSSGFRTSVVVKQVVQRAARNCNIDLISKRGLCCSSALKARDDQRKGFGRKRQDRDSVEIDMDEEIRRYELGKRWLARMMGEDPETFTDDDIERSLAYLLPSGLFAKDARPVMKHPKDLFPEKKESLFDEDKRPISAGYFTGQPKYHDLIYEIYEKAGELDASLISEGLKRQNVAKAVAADDGDITREIARWVNKNEMEALLQEKMVDKQLEVLLFRLKRLAKHPMADTIDDFLQKFQRPVIQANVNIRKGEVDEKGRGHAIGYRKRSIAEVWVSPGNGKVTVNDRSMIDYFPTFVQRQQIMFPFITVDKLRQYDVEANTIGGGLSGQAGAIRLAVSRALAALSEAHENSLLRANLLLRDPRRVERKKPGQKRARKKFAWVKR